MSKKLHKLFREKIMLLDGAMGTALQDRNLSANDFGGEDLDGCNENLVLTRPEIIQEIHEEYLEAGADIVETNTFGGANFVLGEYGLESKVEEINSKAVELAKAACKKFSTPEKPRFVAGAMGPTTKALSVTGGISFDDLSYSFYEQAKALTAAGSDFLLLETALDTLNIKAAYIGILRAFEELGQEIPIAISGTIETMGTMLAGQSVEAFYTSVEHMNPLYIGLNCATGPEFMRDHIRSLSQISKFPVSVVPNAGIPDEEGVYPESPEMLADILESFVNEKWINLLGGCCGTTPRHIKALSLITEKAKPRIPATHTFSRISGIDTLIMEDGDGPYIVGERTNVIGSRKFKKMIEEELFDEASEIARKQVKAGAHVIDICLSNPDRDETEDMINFLTKVTKMTKAPFMIDSQVPEVVEEAFKLIQGKCILNSVNLEDGEDSFKSLLPIVKKYGASVVVGCIEGEMAVTAKDKLKVATNAYELLTKKYGIPEEDIIWDPLVFPCGTGDENYFGSGKETIEGVRLIKEKYPKTRSTLGISNVSFGLPNAGREVLNSVFLHHCVKAGLDTAIVNSEKLVRFSQITEEEKQLCDDLLWYRGDDPVAKFAAYFRGKKSVEKEKKDLSSLTVEKRLEINIVEGTKEALLENIDEALQKYSPLEVINIPLMAGMDIVGKLFNNNELIVAEVLQSAEVMKAAVAYLEPKMEKKDMSLKGVIVLSTVKGDVHDIGKNLVNIILSNNGYKVIDLGIKCPPDKMIAAAIEHHPDVIGMSGLLVKSAQQMVGTVKDFKAAGISTPVLVGGAALTQKFTSNKIQPEYDGIVVYAKDAMHGLDLINQLVDKQKQAEFITRYREEFKPSTDTPTDSKKTKKKIIIKEKKISYDYDMKSILAPNYNTQKLTQSLEHLWPFINRQMLYGHHLGLKGNARKLLENEDAKAMKLHKKILDVKEKIIELDVCRPKGMYQFFKVRKDKETMIILSEDEQQELQRFTFPRQPEGYQFCLTDFIHPTKVDTMCFFVVTSGQEILDYAKELKDKEEFLASHIANAIGLETAEAFAECLHQDIRSSWGFPDDESLGGEDLFKLNYRGRRYSFGYPACPDLGYQKLLWDLFSPNKQIGVNLCDDFMMDPDGSVSALVLHHPQATYFRVKET
ncbi:methionine synthase [Candidatus Marinamargulisbacteria bacterium SCGC AG-343-D04]|nr:methionine synthase [Candidatus Marinamargulisbacteria bacterium SCGC AG-343-D04]